MAWRLSHLTDLLSIRYANIIIRQRRDGKGLASSLLNRIRVDSSYDFVSLTFL